MVEATVAVAMAMAVEGEVGGNAAAAWGAWEMVEVAGVMAREQVVEAGAVWVAWVTVGVAVGVGLGLEVAVMEVADCGAGRAVVRISK